MNSAIELDFAKLCTSAVELNLPEGGSFDEHEIVPPFVDFNDVIRNRQAI
jgi:hypothetical protein